MTAIIERARQPIAVPSARPPAAPFLVCGNLNGQPVSAPARSLDEIISQIDRWTRDDDGCTGYWRLHDDYSDPVTMIVRHKRGLRRGTRWLAHLVRLLPGKRQGFVLPTQCGEDMTILDAEPLGTGMGMPCERCLLLLPQARERIW